MDALGEAFNQKIRKFFVQNEYFYTYKFFTIIIISTHGSDVDLFRGYNFQFLSVLFRKNSFFILIYSASGKRKLLRLKRNCNFKKFVIVNKWND